MAIRFKQITQEKDLMTFQKLTASQVGVELPINYLSQARVIGLIDDQSSEFFGGFVMAFEGPLRCLEQIPKSALGESSAVNNYQNKCFEINGLWLDKKAPPGSRFKLYIHCMKEAIKLGLTGRHKYVYAYGAENPKLRQFYKNFNSTKIYEGPVKQLEGMDKVENEVVEMGCMKRLPLTVLRNPQFLISRAFKRPMNKYRWN